MLRYSGLPPLLRKREELDCQKFSKASWHFARENSDTCYLLWTLRNGVKPRTDLRKVEIEGFHVLSVPNLSLFVHAFCVARVELYNHAIQNLYVHSLNWFARFFASRFVSTIEQTLSNILIKFFGKSQWSFTIDKSLFKTCFGDIYPLRQKVRVSLSWTRSKVLFIHPTVMTCDLSFHLFWVLWCVQLLYRVGWSIRAHPSDELQLLRRVHVHLHALHEDHKEELLPYLFHCFDIDDREVTKAVWRRKTCLFVDSWHSNRPHIQNKIDSPPPLYLQHATHHSFVQHLSNSLRSLHVYSSLILPIPGHLSTASYAYECIQCSHRVAISLLLPL